MGVGFVLPDRPALPLDGLTFDLPCRTSASARKKPHPVTVTADWRLETPHDLEVERIGVALGGVCTCVEHADHTLPAARGLLTHLLRLAPAGLVAADDHSWHVGLAVAGCCDGVRYPTAADAAAHLRRPQHWTLRHGASGRSVGDLVQRILDALGAALADPTLTDAAVREPRCPLPHAASDAYLVEPSGLDELWDAGLHPVDVEQAWRELSPEGEPVRTRLVARHVYSGRDDPWLAPFRAEGPMVLAWAIRHRNGRDARRPDERIAWVRAGLSLPAVAAVLDGDAYTLDDVYALAGRAGRTVGEAARALGRWQSAGLKPAVDALVALYAGPMLLSDPPPLPSVARTVTLAARAGVAVQPADAALALVRAGTAPAAAALLAASRTARHERT